MSQCEPNGRVKPRWSIEFTSGPVQVVSSPASIAGLPSLSACVSLGPPLLRIAPSFAFTAFVTSPEPSPQSEPSSVDRLLPFDVKFDGPPPQLFSRPPCVLFANN